MFSISSKFRSLPSLMTHIPVLPSNTLHLSTQTIKRASNIPHFRQYSTTSYPFFNHLKPTRNTDKLCRPPKYSSLRPFSNQSNSNEPHLPVVNNTLNVNAVNGHGNSYINPNLSPPIHKMPNHQIHPVSTLQSPLSPLSPQSPLSPSPLSPSPLSPLTKIPTPSRSTPTYLVVTRIVFFYYLLIGFDGPFEKIIEILPETVSGCLYLPFLVSLAYLRRFMFDSFKIKNDIENTSESTIDITNNVNPNAIESSSSISHVPDVGLFHFFNSQYVNDEVSYTYVGKYDQDTLPLAKILVKQLYTTFFLLRQVNPKNKNRIHQGEIIVSRLQAYKKAAEDVNQCNDYQNIDELISRVSSLTSPDMFQVPSIAPVYSAFRDVHFLPGSMTELSKQNQAKFFNKIEKHFEAVTTLNAMLDFLNSELDAAEEILFQFTKDRIFVYEQGKLPLDFFNAPLSFPPELEHIYNSALDMDEYTFHNADGESNRLSSSASR